MGCVTCGDTEVEAVVACTVINSNSVVIVPKLVEAERKGLMSWIDTIMEGLCPAAPIAKEAGNESFEFPGSEERVL